MITTLNRELTDFAGGAEEIVSNAGYPEPVQPGEMKGDVIQSIAKELEAVAEESSLLVPSGIPLLGESGTTMPRYVFLGPSGGGDPIRIGIFAGIHGDEPAGCHAVVELCRWLARNPAAAENYHLYLYPLCNPYGLKRGSRYSASGKDLNREFWKGSREAEVRTLEQEILTHTFNGFISLHSDDTSNGMYGFVRGAVLAKSLLEPALIAAEQYLPRNRDAVIDGFAAENGIISHCYDGVLTAPPKLAGTPFEIILETPHAAAMERQVQALLGSMQAILGEYRKFIAFAAGL